MSNNIIKMYPKGAAKNPDAVLEQAVGEYECVVIIGYDKDGAIDVRASTNITQENILWLLEHFKFGLMNGDYSDDEDD